MKPSRMIRILILVSALWMVFTILKTQAAERRPVTVEDVVSMKGLSDPRISPDGSRVAFVVTEADLEGNINDSDIWLVSNGGGDPYRVTRGPKRDDTPRWSPDGSNIAFLSDRGDKLQIFSIAVGGGEAVALTDHGTGVVSFAWSPDGKYIAFVARVPPTEEQEEKRKDGPIIVNMDYLYDQLWKVNIETKEIEQLTDVEMQVTVPAWSPDGKTIAFAARPTPRLKDGKFSDVFFVAAEGGEPRKVPEGPMPKSAPYFLPDGSLVYSSPNGLTALNQRLYRADANGADPRPITDQFDENATFMGTSDEGRNVIFRAGAKTYSHVYSVPVEGGTTRHVTSGEMVITGASSSRDGTKIAFIRHTPTEPPDVFVSDVEDFSARKLTTMNPQAGSFALGEQEVIRWKSSDGWEIEGILVKPVDYEPGKKYPLLLLIHGGPSGVWANGYSLRNSAYPTQVFAGQGYALIMPNPRGSGGYGEKHRRGNWQDLSGKEWDDCIAGVDAVIEMGVGDPDRLGIMGWSYGGHLTYWGITQTERFRAGSAGAGANNLISMYSQTDLPGFYSDTYFGFPPWKRFDFYWERSSLSQVAKVKTPLLIQVGENDERVPKTQSIEFYNALQDLGVPSQLVIYPRQPHGVREPKLVKDLLQRNVQLVQQVGDGDGE